MKNYFSPEIEIIEFSVADVLTNSQVVTTHPAGVNMGGSGGDGYIDFDDEEIIDAILYHTTGRPGMSLLEKIVYIADYIEPGRNHAPNLGEIRELCFADLDEALLKILEDILVHLRESNKEIDPMTQMTYEFYKRKQSEE